MRKSFLTAGRKQAVTDFEAKSGEKENRALSSNSRGNAVSDGSSFRFIFTSIGVNYSIPGIPHMSRKS